MPEDLSLLPPDVTEAFQSEHNDSHSHIQPNVANTIGKQSTSHVVTKNNINSVDAGRIDRIPAVIPTDNITDAALESSVKAINALLCNGLLITKHGGVVYYTASSVLCSTLLAMFIMTSVCTTFHIPQVELEPPKNVYCYAIEWHRDYIGFPLQPLIKVAY